MKYYLQTVASYSRNAIPYLIMGIVFLLNLNQQIAIAGVVLLSAAWLMSGNVKYISSIFKYNHILLFFLFLYWLIHVISLFYSSNVDRGTFDIQQKLSFMLFPIVFSTSYEIIYNNYRKILIAFIAGLIVTGIYSLIKAFVLSFTYKFGILMFNTAPINVPWENYFLYSRFAEPNHPTYYSMGLLLGIAVLFWFIKNRDRSISQLPLMLLIISFFVILILLLSSKAAIITLVVVMLVGFLWLVFKNRGFIFSTLLIVSLLFVFIILGLNNARFSSLIKEIGIVENIESFSSEQHDDATEASMSRIRIWKSVPTIVGSSWLFGVGVGDSSDELVKGYNRLGFHYEAKHSFNAHNQYLETYVALGVFGTVFLIGILAYSLILSLKKRNMLVFLFLLIVCINMMFESIFERFNGIILFALFYSLFFLDINSNEIVRVENKNL